MISDKYEILTHSPLFTGLAPLKIEELLQRIAHRFVRYPQGKTIGCRGDRWENLLILIKGSVKGEMVDLKGRAIEVETITAPRPIAPAFIFGKNNILPVDVVAEQEIVVLMIPKSALISLVQLNTTVLKNYLDLLSNRTSFLSERLWFMSFKTIKEKFAHYLVNLLKPGQTQVTVPKSQQELSEFFGVSRPALARVIGEFVSEGIISHQGRAIIVTDLERLKEIID